MLSKIYVKSYISPPIMGYQQAKAINFAARRLKSFRYLLISNSYAMLRIVTF